MKLVVELPANGNTLLALLPLLDRAGDEAPLDAGTLQDLVDAQESLAQLAIIRVAHHRWQGWPQRLRKGKKGS